MALVLDIGKIYAGVEIIPVDFLRTIHPHLMPSHDQEGGGWGDGKVKLSVSRGIEIWWRSISMIPWLFIIVWWMNGRWMLWPIHELILALVET